MHYSILPQNDSYTIMERRQNIIRFLGEGLTPSDISKKLGVKTDQIYKDIKRIKKAGSNKERALTLNQVSYLYEMFFSNLFHVNKTLWERINDPDILTGDQIRALKAVTENQTAISQLVKDSITLGEVSDLATRVKQLEQEKIEGNNKDSFMNLKLPHIIKDSELKDSDIIDTSNSNIPTQHNADNNKKVEPYT